MHIHHRCIVGEINTHNGGRTCTPDCYHLSTGLCDVQGPLHCRGLPGHDDSEHMIVILGKCLAVGVEEAMKEVVELELLLMSTPG